MRNLQSYEWIMGMNVFNVYQTTMNDTMNDNNNMCMNMC